LHSCHGFCIQIGHPFPLREKSTDITGRKDIWVNRMRDYRRKERVIHIPRHGTRDHPLLYSRHNVRDLCMQVFGFPAGGEWACERKIDRAHFGPLAVPHKFGRNTWRRHITRPLDPRKVPGVTRYARAFAQRRDSRSISRAPSTAR